VIKSNDQSKGNSNLASYLLTNFYSKEFSRDSENLIENFNQMGIPGCPET